jgi:hypothetical protein
LQFSLQAASLETFGYTLVFEPKTEEVNRRHTELNNEEFRELHSSPNIIKELKSRRMSYVGHAIRIEEMTHGKKKLFL